MAVDGASKTGRGNLRGAAGSTSTDGASGAGDAAKSSVLRGEDALVRRATSVSDRSSASKNLLIVGTGQRLGTLARPSSGHAPGQYPDQLLVLVRNVMGRQHDESQPERNRDRRQPAPTGEAGRLGGARHVRDARQHRHPGK